MPAREVSPEPGTGKTGWQQAATRVRWLEAGSGAPPASPAPLALTEAGAPTTTSGSGAAQQHRRHYSGFVIEGRDGSRQAVGLQDCVELVRASVEERL